MFKYVGICFNKYAVCSGRASRSEYWYFILFSFLLGLVCLGIDSYLMSIQIVQFEVFSTVKDLVLFLPIIAVTARRLHDVNKSPWWMLFPFYNFYLFCQPSYIGQNRFDINPHSNTPINLVPTNLTLDDLEKIIRLKEQGHITEEEFQVKKKQILGL